MDHNNFSIARNEHGKREDLIPASGHAFRTQSTENANPELLRLNLVASSETDWEFHTFNPDDPNQQCFFQKDYLQSKVFSKINELGIKSLRSDATLFQQIHHSISPQELRDGHDLNPINPEKVAALKRAVLKHMRRKYGANLICVVIHLDEANPHAISFVVPAIHKTIKRRGRPRKDDNKQSVKTRRGWTLSAKEMFGPLQCSLEQDAFAEACCREGLVVQRGVKGSRTPHQRMRAHLSLVHGPTPAIEHIQLLNVKEGFEGMVQTKQQYFEEAQQDIEEKVQRANEQLATYAAKAQERDREVAQREGYQKTAAEKSMKLDLALQEIERLKNELGLANQKLKDMAEQVRDITLNQIAESLGLQPAESDIFNSQNGQIKIHEKGFVNLTNNAKGRNAIDLTRHVLNCSFDVAVRWLTTYFPDQARAGIRIYTEHKVEEVVQEIRTKTPFTQEESIRLTIKPSELKWGEVKAQLARNYSLPPEKLNEWKAQKLILATESGNVGCFLRNAEHGFDEPATGITVFAPNALTVPVQQMGDSNAVFIIPSQVPNKEQATVITSNPLEAMSLAALRSDIGQVISPAHEKGMEPLLSSLAQGRRQVVLALTSMTGDDQENAIDAKAIMCRTLSSLGRVASDIVEMLVTKIKPIFSSWAKDLRHFKTPSNYAAARTPAKAQNPQVISRS